MVVHGYYSVASYNQSRNMSNLGDTNFLWNSILCYGKNLQCFPYPPIVGKFNISFLTKFIAWSITNPFIYDELIFPFRITEERTKIISYMQCYNTDPLQCLCMYSNVTSVQQFENDNFPLEPFITFLVSVWTKINDTKNQMWSNNK